MKRWSDMTAAQRKEAGLPSAESITEACARADETRAWRRVEAAHLALCALSCVFTMVMQAQVLADIVRVDGDEWETSLSGGRAKNFTYGQLRLAIGVPRSRGLQ